MSVLYPEIPEDSNTPDSFHNLSVDLMIHSRSLLEILIYKDYLILNLQIAYLSAQDFSVTRVSLVHNLVYHTVY